MYILFRYARSSALFWVRLHSRRVGGVMCIQLWWAVYESWMLRIHNLVQRIWRTQRTTATTINSHGHHHTLGPGSRAGLLSLSPDDAQHWPSSHRCYADLGGSGSPRLWWVPEPGAWEPGTGIHPASHNPQLRLRPVSVTESGSGWLLSEWEAGDGASTSWYTVQNKHQSPPQLTRSDAHSRGVRCDLSLLLAELGSDHFIKKFWWLRAGHNIHNKTLTAPPLLILVKFKFKNLLQEISIESLGRKIVKNLRIIAGKDILNKKDIKDSITWIIIECNKLLLGNKKIDQFYSQY